MLLLLPQLTQHLLQRPIPRELQQGQERQTQMRRELRVQVLGEVWVWREWPKRAQARRQMIAGH
jgi:hypothetical protein